MATDKFVTKEQLSEILETLNSNASSYPQFATEIGTWSDGKKLYRKCIYNDDPTKYLLSEGEIEIPFLSPNSFGDLTLMEGCLKDASGNFYSFDSIFSLNQSCVFLLQKSTGKLKILTENYGTGIYLHSLIVEFTEA